MIKEFIQTFRDKRMVMIIFIAPILQLIIFGYAVTTDVKNINLGVMDHDNSPSSRRLIESFERSGYFTFMGSLAGDKELRRQLFSGGLDMALVIPKNFSKGLERGDKVDIQAIFDASDSNFAQVAGGYTQRIILEYSQKAAKEKTDKIKTMAALADKNLSGALPGINPAIRVWYNPELRSDFYMVPGVTCMLLLVVTMLLSGMALTREREIGTIEQLIVSPIASWELILGKLAPFGIMGIIDVALIVTMGSWHFNVPIHGSIPLLFAASALFLFSTLGLGLFFSSISATQQQAMFVIFIFIMPAILLSGFMFPIENMPDAVQYLTLLNPLRYFLEIVRGIFLKGTGVAELWPQLLTLAGFGMVIFYVASVKFSKRLA